ncbi:MAG: hypothetical protein K2Y18_00710 [Alphaproteobacteria bacterium]|jgi:hypothetical protein|nr:hypothetical protein [Alphaproteobacteria bacterium]
MSTDKLRKSLSLLGCLSLVGCTGSTYSSHFDCPYGTGAGCASLSKVNKMIDRHEIDLDEDESLCSTGSCTSKKKQVVIYYGPDQISKVISINTPTR